jgi:hypothetical protein
MFQSLGMNSPKTDTIYRRFAEIATLVIVIGFISIPLAVLARLIS